MGITVPGGDADEFIPPGGITLPEHLTPANLALIGYLLATPLTSLCAFAEFAERGEQPDEGFGKDARTSRREIMRIVDFLMGRYGADIDSIDGLRGFLAEFRKEIEDFQFSRAVATFRAAKTKLHF